MLSSLASVHVALRDVHNHAGLSRRFASLGLYDRRDAAEQHLYRLAAVGLINAGANLIVQRDSYITNTSWSQARLHPEEF